MQTGGDAVMDPLKMAYGVKKPLDQKMDNITQLYNDQKRYYPIDKKGDVDEWGAVQKHRTEAYHREMAEAQIQKTLNQKNLANDLDRQVQQKNQNQSMEGMHKDYERNFMLKAQEFKNAQDRNQYEQVVNQKRAFGEEVKSVIDQKSMQQQMGKLQNLTDEQRILIRDQENAASYAANKFAQKNQQKEILSTMQLQQISEKQRIAEMEKLQKQIPVGLSPGHIGWGYHNQRQFLEEVDKNQDRLYQQYQQQVGSPARDRILSELEKERQKEMEAKMRMDAAASYVQDQQSMIRQNHNEQIRRQMQEQENMKKMQSINQRDQDAYQRMKQQQNNAHIEAEVRQINDQNKMKYKEELDKFVQQKQSMKGYGNMSAAEKQQNKDTLHAYKNFDTSNYAMIPGIHNQGQIQKPLGRNGSVDVASTNDLRASLVGSPKTKKDIQEKVRQNTDKYAQYGAVHLTDSVSSLEPKMYLGHGQLLNGAHPMTQQSRGLSPENVKTKADAHYVGPSGSHIGPGRILNDGTLDREAPGFTRRETGGNTTNSPSPQNYQGSPIPKYTNYMNGQAQPQQVTRVGKHSGLKADPHAANGGIGVSYSNVALGGLHPLIETGKTSYNNHYGNGVKQVVASSLNNFSHIPRFVNNSTVAITGSNASNNEMAYVKGVDFNSQNKYDFNILNNLPNNQNVLKSAGKSMIQ